MKQRIFKFQTLVAVMLSVLVGLSFTACGDDEDDDDGSGEESSKLVGCWIDSYEDLIYDFASDGTYEAYEHVDLDRGTYEDFWDGRWVYDEKEETLRIYEDRYEYDDYSVGKITSSQMVLYEEDGDRCVYNRISRKDLPTRYVGY